MESDRKVILYIAMSLDGFIAGHDDDLGFLSMVEKMVKTMDIITSQLP